MKKSRYDISVVGATGLVGRTIIDLLEKTNFPVGQLILVASSKSVGKKMTFRDTEVEIVDIDTAVALAPHIAIFSAGKTVALTYAPKFAEKGTIVIDNSSAWRMDSEVPLIVPEINAHILDRSHKIIANPNCSTIQMVMALFPLHQYYGLKEIVVSTYQSVSGSGMKGIEQLKNERAGIKGDMCYPHPIDLNVIPQGGEFVEDGYTDEEMKLVNETRKILSNQEIKISPTVVRVPVTGGHSESIYAVFERDIDLNQVHKLLKQAKGVELFGDDNCRNYPMPLFVEGKDDIFVGRIRKSLDYDNAINIWVVADNLRKGAATNAIQIARYIAEEIIA